MSSPYVQKIQTIASILDNAREQALEVAGNDPLFSIIKLRIDKQLKILSNSVNFSADLSPNIETEKIEFGPLEKIDGQYIKTLEVKQEDITPSKTEEETLKDKVFSLERSLQSHSNEEILKSYVTGSDELVIRGLAKKAGVADYQDVKIDGDLFARIRAGIDAKKKQSAGDKTAIVAQIKAAQTKEDVEELAKGNEDEQIQNAALEKIIELEG